VEPRPKEAYTEMQVDLRLHLCRLFVFFDYFLLRQAAMK